ncbi:putative ribonuclease H-like domain-containing protein [Tanacetum coccineum]
MVEKLQFDAKEPVGFDKTKVECFKWPQTGALLQESVEGGREWKERWMEYWALETGRELDIEDEKHNCERKKTLEHYCRDKFGLGFYGVYRYSGIGAMKMKFSKSFRCNESDYENPPLHKRLAKTCEMQADSDDDDEKAKEKQYMTFPCLFAVFYLNMNQDRLSEALEDKSWVDAMQEELLQFEIQKVWILVYLPYGKKAIGTKWVYRNKKDERGVVVRNKARLGFIVYQMDVKSAFLYGKIDEEVYVSQPQRFKDLSIVRQVLQSGSKVICMGYTSSKSLFKSMLMISSLDLQRSLGVMTLRLDEE